MQGTGESQFFLSREDAAEGFAGNIFEDDEGVVGVGIFADIKDRHDAGMLQTSGSLGFAHETLTEFFLLLGFLAP